MSATYLKSYFEHAQPAGFLPKSKEELDILFDVFLLEKAVAELGQELRHRMDWVAIPMRGILDMLNEPIAAGS